MGSNRVIDADNDLIIKGITWPSSDGNANQVIKTNGSGTLSFTDIVSGSDVDEITSISDASNYTGTSRIIHITSNSDVTFTNTNITDRIIFCNKSLIVKFITENFKRNLVYHSNSLKIHSPHTAPSAGVGSADTTIEACSIFCDSFEAKAGSIFDSMGSSNVGLNFVINTTSLHAKNSVIFDYNTSGLGTHKNFSCEFVTKFLTNIRSTTSGAIDCNQSTFNSRNITNSFKFTDCNASIASGTAGVLTTKILIGSTEYINGSFSNGFQVLGDQINSSVNFIANTDANQTIPNNVITTLIFEDEILDNTSAYNTSTGVFTAPVKGVYKVDARASLTSTITLDENELIVMSIWQDSASPVEKITGSFIEGIVSTDNSTLYTGTVSGCLSLEAGDELLIRIFQNTGAAKTINSVGKYNNLCITKVN